MPASRPNTLAVPGAELYYETCGTGPLLLIIPGGPQDAGVFAELAAELSNQYKVLAFDPRGNSRTTTEAEPGTLDVDLVADDAAALISANGGGPAFVFGTSGGAQIGLSLAARHPDSVAALVAHEPPTIMLLPDPEPALAGERALHETYKRDGVEAAMGQFFAENGLDGDDSEGPPDFDMPPEAAETFARVSANFEYWLAHGMLPLSTYQPRLDVLRSGKPRITVAIGEQSAGQPIEAMGQALVARLGIAPTPFPGDHMGFETDAAGFAAALDRAFKETQHG
ncbi:alpha/beta fold hydrolase [Devosia ginsengisoli]|uniref:Alpha/beta hydrolase n=1 Tax=Devosia ginsengisoli TaxID=400770 RepID=A0A5B8LR93_9HYPH|nr:alpha/beta hydrolase [Devosia ginsengisoli]QDZ10616.1 alpha/beta hydrolase [Devosia ginsengisoli]